MFSFKNITKDLLSTILGGILFFAALISVFIKELEVDWYEAIAAMLVGLALMGVDTKHLRGGSAPVWVAMVLLPIICSNCKTAAPQVLYSHDTLIREIRTRDSTIIIKGDTARVDNTDAIKAMLLIMQQKGDKPQLVYKSDSKGYAKLKFSLDSIGRVSTDCECKDSLYQVMIHDYFEREFKSQTILAPEEEKDHIPIWLIIAVLVSLAINILLVIKSLFR